MAGTYDVAIIGAGTMGSAVAYHLSDRGKKVIAFEQFRIPHELGSHTGKTRIIRHAYFESPEYVPLVIRSHELWQRLQELTGMLLLLRTGCLDMGLPSGKLVQGSLQSARVHSLPHQLFSFAEIRKKWPQFRIPEEWAGCYDENGGFLFVEPCINAHIGAAQARGACIREEEKVLGFEPATTHVTIRTSRGNYEAEKLIVCSGAWTAKLLRELKIPLRVTRQTVAWLRPEEKGDFSLEKFLVFIAETEEGIFYGFPIHHYSGLKLAHHLPGPMIDPDDPNRTFQYSDAASVVRFARKFLNKLTDEVLQGKICLYSTTQDENFIIDFYPGCQNILIAAGFSGHGFKFAPVIGEILTDLVCNGKSSYSIDLFRFSRFLS